MELDKFSLEHLSRIMVGGLDYWLDLEDWEITDTLTGAAYKKLPPEVVTQWLEEDEDD